MKSVSLRDFQLKPSKYLEELPIVLTRYSRKIAVVSAPGAPTKIKKVKKSLETLSEEKDIKTCKHGAMIGLCKHGCKK